MSIYKPFEPPDDLSKRNYQELLETFPTGRWVSFIGAGASKPAGIPVWGDMLQELIRAKNLNLSVGDYEGEYPELGSAIYAEYEALSCQQEFYDRIAAMCEPTVTRFSGLHAAVINVIRVHITTNFDCILENAYDLQDGGATPSCQYFPYFDPSQLTDDTIVYLHANRHEKLFVFRKEEFESYYPSVSRTNGSRQIESLLRHVFENFHMLFMGCSFQDRYIRGALAATWSDIMSDVRIEEDLFGHASGPSDISHYALLPTVTPSDDSEAYQRQLADQEALIAELANCNVHSICYANKVDIETILAQLRHDTQMAKPLDIELAFASDEDARVLRGR